jgi:hypothetical protein
VSLQFDVSLSPSATYPDKAVHCEWLTQLEVAHSHVSDPLAVATFLADMFPNLTLHHEYYTPTDTGDFEDELDEDEQSPEYIEMAKRWKDVDQILNARRQQSSRSLTNRNVRMQSLI